MTVLCHVQRRWFVISFTMYGSSISSTLSTVFKRVSSPQKGGSRIDFGIIAVRV